MRRFSRTLHIYGRDIALFVGSCNQSQWNNSLSITATLIDDPMPIYKQFRIKINKNRSTCRHYKSRTFVKLKKNEIVLWRLIHPQWMYGVCDEDVDRPKWQSPVNVYLLQNRNYANRGELYAFEVAYANVTNQ